MEDELFSLLGAGRFISEGGVKNLLSVEIHLSRPTANRRLLDEGT
jgi:hypothetical protein